MSIAEIIGGKYFNSSAAGDVTEFQGALAIPPLLSFLKLDFMVPKLGRARLAGFFSKLLPN